jgi:DNA-binding NarL/FixJ family response regulator
LTTSGQGKRRGTSSLRLAPPSPSEGACPWSGLVGAVHLPALVIALDDLTIQAVTAAGQRLIGLSALELIGRHVGELIEASDRARILGALDTLMTGHVDLLRAHPRGVGAGGRITPLVAWIVALGINGRRVALVAWEEADRLRSRVAGELMERVVAIALADAAGFVRSVTIRLALEGLTVDDLLAMSLGPADPRPRRGGGREDPASISDEVGFGSLVVVRTTAGGSVTLQAITAALVGSDERLVLFLRPSGMSRRVTRLEEHLRRIAAEIEASGLLLRTALLPGVALASLPEVSMLSPRQLDVLRRLAAGQRVPTIAAELFVSQSTVRNHLSAIFEIFDVHSQSDLLERLSRSDVASS